MTQKISQQRLLELSGLISSLMGLHFPESRLADLERGILEASRALGFNDMESFTDWLKTGALARKHIEVLASHLTIGETYFFREKDTFKALEGEILPEIIRSKADSTKTIRIWSAGCSTGEEPYSVAILLSRIIPDIRNWNIHILATDINPKALNKAYEGVYSDWSFRDAPLWLKDRFFRKDPRGCFEIAPFIKRMVTFEYLNLAEDVYPSLLNNTNAMDLIFCRNVLMYFSNEISRKVVRGFHNSIVEGGWLLLSPTEIIKGITKDFALRNFPGVTLYRKDSHRRHEEAHESKHAHLPLPQAFKTEDAVIFRPKPVVIPKAPLEPQPKKDIPSKPETDIAAPGQADIDMTAVLADFEKGLYLKAAADLELLASGSKDPRIYGLLAKAYANSGRLDAARSWCEKGMAVDRLNPVSHYMLATILIEQGKFADAVKSLKRSLYLDQKFALAHFVLGNLSLKLGDEASSLRHLRNALETLSILKAEEIIPESEGMTAGRLTEIIDMMMLKEKAS